MQSGGKEARLNFLPSFFPPSFFPLYCEQIHYSTIFSAYIVTHHLYYRGSIWVDSPHFRTKGN